MSSPKKRMRWVVVVPNRVFPRSQPPSMPTVWQIAGQKNVSACLLALVHKSRGVYPRGIPLTIWLVVHFRLIAQCCQADNVRIHVCIYIERVWGIGMPPNGF